MYLCLHSYYIIKCVNCSYHFTEHCASTIDFGCYMRKVEGNKLKTYTTFKHECMTEPYVCIVAQKKYRSAYVKFRCGVAPIKIETGRYGVNRIPPEARLCMQCSRIEDEFYVIMQCPLYDDVRSSCLKSIHVLSHEFNELTSEHQFI